MSYLTKEAREEIYQNYGGSPTNSGSVDSQIALFTKRILHLTEHLKKNKKDFSTQRALLKLVGKRRRMLDYVKANDIEHYREILKAHKLRK